MRPSTRWAAGTVMVAFVAGHLAAQAPPPPPSIPAPGKTTVAGTVVDAVSRKPIGGAVVSLSTVPRGSALQQFDTYAIPYELMSSSPFRYGTVMTGADGRFEFRNIGPEAVALDAHNSGWSFADRGGWEAADPELGGDWMAISTSMRTAEIVVPLRRVPVLRGRVVDEHGDPVAGVQVHPLSRDSGTGGRSWRSFYAFRTDDRGQFYFLVHPGDFLVRVRPAAPPGEDSLRAPTINGQRFAYAPSWYSRAQAGGPDVIAARRGDVRDDVNIQLVPVPAFSVRGTVAGWQDPTRLSVSLRRDDEVRVSDPDWEKLTTGVDAQGRFAFRPMPAGRYVLRALEAPQMPFGSHGPPALKELPVQPTLAAELTVDLVERDLDVRVPLRSGSRISGRVEFEGEPSAAALAQLKNLVIRIERADGAYSDFRGLFLDSGSFTTIQLPPGRYVVRNGAPQGWRVRSVVHEGRDVADEPIEIADRDVTGVVMTFASSRSFLSGTVSGAAEKHLRPWVVVFPAERRLWTDFGSSSRRIAVAQIGSAGTYAFELPPGGYFVCAVDEPVAALTPDVLAVLAGRATQVWIAQGERRTQPLPLPTGRGRQ